ncbi:MAG: hypothetical protein V4538_08170 [Bacteroidota bacterium]
MKLLDKTTKRLLSKEAALSSMNLGVGLTFLRRHNFTQIGFIYQSFFSLSVGLERLMKLILVYEHIYVNDTYPKQENIKNFGHNLTQLFLKVRELSTKYSADRHFNSIDEQDLCITILQNLSDFAKQNRYSHLNQLTGNNTTDDPLIRWETEIGAVIVNRYYRPTKNDRVMTALASVVAENSIVRHTSESDNDITDYNQLTKNGLHAETKQKYGQYFTFMIIKALCELQINQSYQSQTNIALHEFFTTFRVEPNYALKRKSWNPYSPYKF